MSRFSARTHWELEENEFAAAVRASRERNNPLLDLTLSNPTAAAFAYPATWLAPLSAPESWRYEPAAFGMEHARSAVARYYASLGAVIEPRHLCLTTSTSEAYSYLFRLLCDPGDEVLIARPSYPLFDYIARLDGVTLREYPLHYDLAGERWWLDLAALRAAVTTRTRAVIVVHPNNPTSSYLSSSERDELRALCSELGLALIVDEVFLEYAFGTGEPSFLAEAAGPLTFVLSGLSKVVALPQMKCSWIACAGPEDLVRDALARLEIIADTFLSINAPVQFALQTWLSERGEVQRQIHSRLRENLTQLQQALKGTHASLLQPEGGWTAVLQVPRQIEGVPYAWAALDRGVLVQPGEFYGMGPDRIVLSLLTPQDTWRAGLARLPL